MFWKTAACLAVTLLPALADDTSASLPDGPGKETTVKLLQMIKRGAKGTDDQFGEVVDYLAAHFPKEAKVMVNTASAHDLEVGLGISEKDASAIVNYRQEKGAFKTFEDLVKVPGIDISKLETRRSTIEF